MKKRSLKFFVALCAIGTSFSAIAGNKDRSGQAGAPELNINPWARSTGVFGLNASYISGVEAMKTNIAGLANTNSTEIGVSRGTYLSGTNININNIAVGQKLGEAGVIGINLMSMNFGDITTTEYFNPEGVGSYRPQFLNMQLGYAKQFSSHVNAGAAVTYVSEQVGNITALGIAFEGGIQYVTGKKDNFHFGITLRNLGSNMRFTGTGFSVNADKPQSSPSFAVSQTYPADKFSMPTYLNFGGSYDFYLDENHVSSKDSLPKHRLTAIANFQSNSFNNDYLGLGMEYGFREMIMLRAAYRYEKGIGSAENSTTMYSGIAVGATAQKRFGENGPMVSFDYSFRPTQRPANGVHMMSLRVAR
ncbi:MAG: PorV/PorQ family protein [Taibaiella sp.]|nr:PorV/PorQ family protein [Taibaiella sp.]